MLYITTSEIALFTPQVTVPITPTDQRMPYIHLASRLVDAACGRSRFGLGIASVYNEPVALDLDYNGFLPHDPFIGWLAPTATVTLKNVGNQPTISVAYLDVDQNNSIVRFIGDATGVWPNRTAGIAGPWAQTTAQYHTSSLYQVTDNTYPFTMNTSFSAGRFGVTNIVASGSIGSNQVMLTDALAVTGLAPGRQFYFSTDPVSEPTVDTRYVTAFDPIANTVTFSPSLGYSLPSTASFRMIDHAVRLACGLIISDLIIYPPNTKRYNKSLGNNAITKSWFRNTQEDIPGTAMDLLGPYIRY